ncbi:MAG TPA: M15 family metallopeptidase [Patescibacteria group bacterium]|nr:M15 family metallopeptidase [Patescibacteria group bacterium]
MTYKDTLTKYVSGSKSRRRENDNLIGEILAATGAESPANAAAPSVLSSGGGSGSVGNSTGTGGSWGNPDSKDFASNYLTTIKTPDGRKVTVHKNAAQAFKGFLGALYSQGYVPKSIQSYSNRNIAGTNTKSEHAWANAIDLDPYVNRGDRLGGGGTTYGNLPKNVAQLAAQYGLTWGGTWRNRDPMHFEYKRR